MPIPALPPLAPKWAADTRSRDQLITAVRDQVIVLGDDWLRAALWRIPTVGIKHMSRLELLGMLQHAEAWEMLPHVRDEIRPPAGW